MSDQRLEEVRKEVEDEIKNDELGFGDYYLRGTVAAMLAKELIDEVDRLRNWIRVHDGI